VESGRWSIPDHRPPQIGYEAGINADQSSMTSVARRAMQTLSLEAHKAGLSPLSMSLSMTVIFFALIVKMLHI